MRYSLLPTPYYPLSTGVVVQPSPITPDVAELAARAMFDEHAILVLCLHQFGNASQFGSHLRETYFLLGPRGPRISVAYALGPWVWSRV